MSEPFDLPGVRAELTRFINDELLGADDAGCTETDDLLMSGLVDSISIMRLIAHIEDSFAIAVPPEDVTIERFETVVAIGDYLQERAGARG